MAALVGRLVAGGRRRASPLGVSVYMTPVVWQVRSLVRRLVRRSTGRREENKFPDLLALLKTTHLSLKSLCGGGAPSSHPSLGLSVFFLSFVCLCACARYLPCFVSLITRITGGRRRAVPVRFSERGWEIFLAIPRDTGAPRKRYGPQTWRQVSKSRTDQEQQGPEGRRGRRQC